MSFKRTNSVIVEKQNLEKCCSSQHIPNPSEGNRHREPDQEISDSAVSTDPDVNKIKNATVKPEEANQNNEIQMRSEQLAQSRKNNLMRRNSSKTNFRMPSSIVLSIRRLKDVGTEAADDKPKQMKVSRRIKEMLSPVRVCQICESEVKDKQKASMCQCEHEFDFCESCLHHYIIFKVKMFQEVYCPSDGCQFLINMDSLTFKHLPADIQTNYRKMHIFYETAKDPTLKLCPKQFCEGVIKLLQNGPFICNTCATSFCGKCFFTQHLGQCDKHEVEFFENNLHYRQCTKCKFIIEKNQGCNHMTCRCGFQFCYVCGKRWTSDHVCGQTANCCDCETCLCFCDHDCCDCFGCFRGFCRIMCKVLLFFWYLTLQLTILLARDLFVITGMFLLTLAAGLFGSSFEFLCDQESCICILLLVLFFPICMIIGVAMAFKEIFCETVTEHLGNSIQGFCDRMGSLCDD